MNNIAIIMCTWKRIERLTKTLDLLCAQTNHNFTFHIWNNNQEIRDEINLICNTYKDRLEIRITNSKKNIGGFGRFLAAKEIVNEFEKIIFIDDDQVFSDNMINRFLEVFDENALKSRWSWRFNSINYLNRNHINDGNIPVHYCGTGGMIVSSKIFTCDELYKIPIEFLFVEDLWICFIASHYLKLNLISITNDFMTQEVDGKDQTTGVFYDVKTKFLEYLINQRGWEILNT